MSNKDSDSKGWPISTIIAFGYDRDANFSGNVKTVGNIPEISKKKIGNIPKFFDLQA